MDLVDDGIDSGWWDFLYQVPCLIIKYIHVITWELHTCFVVGAREVSLDSDRIRCMFPRIPGTVHVGDIAHMHYHNDVQLDCTDIP